MDRNLLLTLGILVVAVALLLSDRLRPDLVALLVVVALGLCGVLTPQEAFSGFSRSAVVTILAIFILTEGLRRSGVTERVGSFLLRLGGKQESRLVAVVMVAGAFFSLFMNNIAAASVLLPAVTGAARKARLSLSRLLLPLALGTILGGMATLLTTTNIIVSSLLQEQGLAGYGLLDFAPVGLPIVAVGIAYMVLWGRRRLPEALLQEREGPSSRPSDLVEVYRLGERLFRARIPAGSYLVGRPLVQSTFRERYGLTVVALEREGRVLLSPSPDTRFQEGDIVLLEGRLEEFRRRDVPPYLEILPPRPWCEQDLESPEVAVVEAVLAPRSTLIGQTLRSAHFREKYGLNVLGIWRAGRPIRTALSDLPLQFGDAMLLQGPRRNLPLLRGEPDLILLGEEEEAAPPRRGWMAPATMAATLVLVALFPSLMGELMLGGALLMVLSGALTMDQAYRAVEWKSLFLIAGMLPLGTAMAKTGAAALLAGHIVSLLGPAGPWPLLAGFFLLAMLLTQVMHGAAVAGVVAPMAVQAALAGGINPRSLAMAVALATSMAFLTPLGHPVNVLVMGPAGYRFRDYLRVGLPLTLLLSALILLLLPVLWPL
ncbi:MAG: SLC13 family permease [Chloroflexia bacterium]